MKSILFWVFILGSVPVFAQSAKKVNKQLRAEYLVEKHQYDSISVVFLNDRNFLEKLREQLHDKIFGSLATEENKAKRSLSVFESNEEVLKELGFDPKTLVSDTAFLGSRYATSRELFEFHKEALQEYIRFDTEKRGDLSFLNQHKIKEQNTLLAELVTGYRDRFESNQLHLRDQREYITELEGFEPQLDRLIGMYRNLEARLDQANQTLKDKLKELETNYKLKGPGGFSPAYQRIFPDVYPTKVSKVGVQSQDNIGTKNISGQLAEETILIHNYVDQPAEFPGGMNELKSYLVKNLMYPQISKELGVSGKVFLRFIVTDKGKISNVEILRGVPDGLELDMEAKRVVKAMPDWIPAKIDSKPVNSYYVLPIWFKL